MNSQSLRDIVAARVEGRWTQFAQAHPHLAEAIDRTRLIDTATQRLRDDPHFIDAMRQADFDEKTMLSAIAFLERLERVLVRVLPL